MKDRFTHNSSVERGRIRPAIRAEIYARDGFRCQFCQQAFAKDQLTIDHLIPLALGGVDEVVNYVTACGPCNARKAAQPLAAFASSIAIAVEGLPVHGDPVIDNDRLPIQIRLLRKRVFDAVRAGELAAPGRRFQHRVEREYRRAFWDTAEGKALEAQVPLLPGHVRIMIPEIQTIANSRRDYLLLLELAKSANTRNLIGTTLTEGTPSETVVRRLAVASPDQALRKRLENALRRFEAAERRAPEPDVSPA